MKTREQIDIIVVLPDNQLARLYDSIGYMLSDGYLIVETNGCKEYVFAPGKWVYIEKTVRRITE